MPRTKKKEKRQRNQHRVTGACARTRAAMSARTARISRNRRPDMMYAAAAKPQRRLSRPNADHYIPTILYDTHTRAVCVSVRGGRYHRPTHEPHEYWISLPIKS